MLLHMVPKGELTKVSRYAEMLAHEQSLAVL
jgi:hypothetical protein